MLVSRQVLFSKVQSLLLIDLIMAAVRKYKQGGSINESINYFYIYVHNRGSGLPL